MSISKVPRRLLFRSLISDSLDLYGALHLWDLVYIMHIHYEDLKAQTCQSGQVS
jgi:hypothetical protein